jgi:hypothetical protein
MADFTRQREFKTREPQIAVDKTLPLGVHTFQLVVVDQSGNQSRPAQIRVVIARSLTPVTPGGTIITGGPVVIR